MAIDDRPVIDRSGVLGVYIAAAQGIEHGEGDKQRQKKYRGEKYEEINFPFKSELEKVDSITYPSAPIPSSAPYVVLDTKMNASYAVVFGLLKYKPEIL